MPLTNPVKRKYLLSFVVSFVALLGNVSAADDDVPQYSGGYLSGYWYDATQGWKLFSNISGAVGYDTNINNSPGIAGIDEVEDATYRFTTDMVVDRIVNQRTHFSFGLHNHLMQYFDNSTLNWYDINGVAEVSHVFGEDFLLGLALSATNHHRPNVMDLAERVIGNDFTYVGVLANPYMVWDIHSNLQLQWDCTFEVRDYDSKAGAEDYDFHLYATTLELRRQVTDVEVGFAGDFVYKDYGDLTAYNSVGVKTPGETRELRDGAVRFFVGYDNDYLMPMAVVQ